MARVGGAGASKNTEQGVRRSAQVAKEREQGRKKHKVVMESVSKEQNKLRSVITFAADPPPGYTFIPAGNPELTNALKEFARKGDHKIFAVTTTPHATRHELSREVHRVGFHFPTIVVAQVCAHYGIRLNSSGRMIDDRHDSTNSFMKVYQKGQLVLDEKVQDQVTINTDAKQTIKDLFPEIPDKDLFQIIKTAFQLGQGRVGTADEIPLVRRAQLAVVAHIRHIYTNYDKLLRMVPYVQARHRVERETLVKLVEWRGDDQADGPNKQAVDDLVREVVYISDDEESDSDVQEMELLDHATVQVEELPHSAYPVENRRFSPTHISDENRAPAGYRYATHVRRSTRPNPNATALRDRYAIWDEVIEDYRARLAGRPRGLQPLQSTVEELSHRPEQILPPIEYEQSIRRPASHTYVRGTDGRLYEEVPALQPDRTLHHTAIARLRTPPLSTPHPGHSGRDPRGMDPPLYSKGEHRRTASYTEVGSSHVLPSIEAPQSAIPIETSYRQMPSEPNRVERFALHRDDMRSRESVRTNLANSPVHVSRRQQFKSSPPRNKRRISNDYHGIATGSSANQLPGVLFKGDGHIIDLGEPLTNAHVQMHGNEGVVHSSRVQTNSRHNGEIRHAAPMHRPIREIIDLGETLPVNTITQVPHQASHRMPSQVQYVEPQRTLGRDDKSTNEAVYQLERLNEGRVQYSTRRIVVEPDLPRHEPMRSYSVDEAGYRHRAEYMPLEIVPSSAIDRGDQTRPRREYIAIDDIPQRQPPVRYNTIHDDDPQRSARQGYTVYEERSYANPPRYVRESHPSYQP